MQRNVEETRPTTQHSPTGDQLYCIEWGHPLRRKCLAMSWVTWEALVTFYTTFVRWAKAQNGKIAGKKCILNFNQRTTPPTPPAWAPHPCLKQGPPARGSIDLKQKQYSSRIELPPVSSDGCLAWKCFYFHRLPFNIALLRKQNFSICPGV